MHFIFAYWDYLLHLYEAKNEELFQMYRCEKTKKTFLKFIILNSYITSVENELCNNISKQNKSIQRLIYSVQYKIYRCLMKIKANGVKDIEK